MHRPYFEYEVENRVADEADEEDELHDRYKKKFYEAVKSGIILEPAKDHPGYKWVILREGFKNFSDYRRRSNYCDPDRFGMYLYDDFAGKGLMELMENLVCVIFAGCQLIRKVDKGACQPEAIRTYVVLPCLCYDGKALHIASDTLVAFCRK